MPLEPVGLDVGVGSTAVHCLLKPRLVLKLRTALNPFQSVYNLSVMGQQQILPQPQQPVHDLPRGVVFCGEQSTPCRFPRVPDKAMQGIRRLLDGE